MSKRKRYKVGLKVLPGQPANSTGRVCIHLFVPDESGPFVEGNVTHVVDRKLVQGPVRGRIACNSKKLVSPVTRNGVIEVTLRSADPRAVTCPKCIASPDYYEVK